MDSNKFSIGIHSFKVLVQIHYSQSPSPQNIKKSKIIHYISPCFSYFQGDYPIILVSLASSIGGPPPKGVGAKPPGRSPGLLLLVVEDARGWSERSKLIGSQTR